MKCQTGEHEKTILKCQETICIYNVKAYILGKLRNVFQNVVLRRRLI